MNLFDADPPDSSQPPPAPPPDWEFGVLEGLQKIAPELDYRQRRLILAALKLWGKYCNPAPPDPLAAGLAPVVWLPLRFLEIAPFQMSANQMRACLRFFESRFGLARLGFNELISALSALRNRAPRPAALLYRRAAA
jgi:hypothetical protein